MIDFHNRVLSAQLKQADAMIEKHKINIEVLTKNASGVADHPDIMKTVEDELNSIGHWEEIKSVIKKHFDFENKRTLTE
tara:strand:- start:833 stop:1069 length:237 start_codon:yes stop_codon:yes gene_type:complete